MLLTFVASLALATWMLVAYGSPTATDTGRGLYPYRRVLAELDEHARGPRPDVLWLGDSTITSNPAAHAVPYTQLIQQQDLAPRGLLGITVQAEGFDAYAFHSIAPKALELKPRLVVLIANLRLFASGGGTTRTFDDLTASRPTIAEADTLTLPYNFRGMTLLRLALTRVLRSPWALDWFYWFEGMRSEIQQAPFWERFGPESPRTDLPPVEVWARGWKNSAKGYDTAIASGTPLVRFLAATVSEITASGAAALVIVTPIPWEQLSRDGFYDAARYAARIDTLRAAVEGSGGELLDLHRAVEASSFRDLLGHFNPEGMEKMRSLVWPRVAGMLHVGSTPTPENPGSGPAALPR